MVFTVVNYLPLLEEEASHSKKEHVKKNEAKESGSGEPDDETDTDRENVGTSTNALRWIVQTSALNTYQNQFHHYDYLLEGCTSPPPEK